MPQPPANQPQPPAGQPEGQPQPGGAGAGAAVDPGDWQGHDEYGQDAEPGWEKEQRGAPDWTKDAHGPDGKDRYGKDAKDEHGKDDRGGRPDDKGKDGKDEHGSWQDGKDDWQASGGAWQDDKGDYGKEAERDYGKDGWEHGKDFVYYGEATVSHDARPGRYELRGTCGEGELVVLPRGGVDGGDGGMTTTGVDRTLATGGAGMIGAAALGGLVAWPCGDGLLGCLGLSLRRYGPAPAAGGGPGGTTPLGLRPARCRAGFALHSGVPARPDRRVRCLVRPCRLVGGARSLRVRLRGARRRLRVRLGRVCGGRVGLAADRVRLAGALRHCHPLGATALGALGQRGHHHRAADTGDHRVRGDQVCRQLLRGDPGEARHRQQVRQRGDA
nr:hypothetical protein [Micromonospora provocatoris]